jgi:hypothetical protein
MMPFFQYFSREFWSEATHQRALRALDRAMRERRFRALRPRILDGPENPSPFSRNTSCRIMARVSFDFSVMRRRLDAVPEPLQELDVFIKN